MSLLHKDIILVTQPGGPQIWNIHVQSQEQGMATIARGKGAGKRAAERWYQQGPSREVSAVSSYHGYLVASEAR